MRRIVKRLLGAAGYRLMRASYAESLENRDAEAALLVTLRRGFDFASIASPYGQFVEYDRSDLGMNLSGAINIELIEEAAFIVKTVKPGHTVIDVGANIGVLTLLMARAVGPGGRVYAFEPGQRSFQLLQRNIAGNGFKNVVAENAAVADESGFADLQVSLSGESDNRLSGVTATPGSFRTVPTRVVSLDDLLGGEHIDFIKIDAQGSEFRILQGLRKIIAANPSITITAEFSPHWLMAAGVSFDVWFNLIRDLNLQVSSILENGDTVPVSPRWLMNEVGGNELPQINVVLRPIIQTKGAR
jgi:FkbM family methyltransferase